MPARIPSVASSPAIIHAAYLEAGSERKAAAMLGISRSTVYDQLHGRHAQMSARTTERVGRHVANALDRNTRQQLVGSANLIRARARGDPQRMGAERVALTLETPAERRALIRTRQRQHAASDQAYARYLASQRGRTRSPVRVPTSGRPTRF